MTLTSFHFFVYVLTVLLAYYLFQPIQKFILLAASVYFYLKVSTVNPFKLCVLMLCIFSVTYFGAVLTEKCKGTLKRIIVGASIASIIMVLFVLKYAFNILSIVKALLNLSLDISVLQFASVVGISYYALSAIGYLVDVYWESYPAERDPVKIALFIFYFPQLISGPFTRFSNMKNQFAERAALKYDNISNGLRRMAWGYFKKLVISERFGIVVSAVYGAYTQYSFAGIVGATLCYAIQLYTDFSGCMDIIMGVSCLFGIELPENFKAPFFSESIQEFWQRWHITLGTWFKDYLMYPVQKSKPLQALGKKSKKYFGKKGRKVPFFISMILLWFMVGIWHGGTGYYFIASAGIPCTLLMLSIAFQPYFRKIVDVLCINTECASWHWFRRLRTLLLICICWVFVCAKGTFNAINVFKQMFSSFCHYTPFTSAMETFGLSALDVVIMLLGVMLLYIADRFVYQGTTIFKVMDEQNTGFRVLLIYLEVITIFLYGMVGASSFIYFRF